MKKTLISLSFSALLLGFAVSASAAEVCAPGHIFNIQTGARCAVAEDKDRIIAELRAQVVYLQAQIDALKGVSAPVGGTTQTFPVTTVTQPTPTSSSNSTPVVVAPVDPELNLTARELSTSGDTLLVVGLDGLRGTTVQLLPYHIEYSVNSSTFSKSDVGLVCGYGTVSPKDFSHDYFRANQQGNLQGICGNLAPSLKFLPGKSKSGNLQVTIESYKVQSVNGKIYEVKGFPMSSGTIIIP